MQSTQFNATSGNSINTPNIYTVQGPRGRDGRDGVPGRDGRDGVPEAKEKEETLVCRDYLDHEVNVYIGKKYSV